MPTQRKGCSETAVSRPGMTGSCYRDAGCACEPLCLIDCDILILAGIVPLPQLVMSVAHQHFDPSSEDIESQPLLIADAHPGQKQEKWTTYPNQSDHQLLTPATPSTNTLLLFAGAIMLSIFALVSFFAFHTPFDCFYNPSTSNQTRTQVQFAPPEIQQSWGAYTPYFPVKPYIPPPSHCHLTQVRSIDISFHLFSITDFVSTGQHRRCAIRGALPADVDFSHFRFNVTEHVFPPLVQLHVSLPHLPNYNPPPIIPILG